MDDSATTPIHRFPLRVGHGQGHGVGDGARRTFTAHVQVAHEGQAADAWFADAVPGGLVKQSGGGRGGKSELVLVAFGSDAKSELDSK